MRNASRIPIKEPDAFDILCAAWILACNDENPIITYEGIKHRLNLQNDFDIRGLIRSRGELFRRGVPSFRLREWKQDMLRSKHLPSWIREIENPATQKQKIESLVSDDVFRSQFRAESSAERSPVEIIDWGLQHIERLRRANLEAREQSAKSWQIWLVFAVGIINIVATIVVALLQQPTS